MLLQQKIFTWIKGLNEINRPVKTREIIFLSAGQPFCAHHKARGDQSEKTKSKVSKQWMTEEMKTTSSENSQKPPESSADLD